MDTDIASLWSLCLLCFALGLRHGFDADHLAVIDGVTRINASTRPRFARYAGVLFSAGHAGIVFLVSLAIAWLATGWQPPQWLEWSGSVIAFLFLASLGIANIRAAWNTPHGVIVRPVGFRANFVGQINSPFAMAATGALFALSFDSVSQAVFFSISGSQFGGGTGVMLAAFSFFAGMVMTDGLNGFWISRMLDKADHRSFVASRIMSWTIGAMSLVVAAFLVGSVLSPAMGEEIDSHGIWLSAAVLAGVALAFLGTLLLRDANAKEMTGPA